MARWQNYILAAFLCAVLFPCLFFYLSHRTFSLPQARDVVITHGNYRHVAQELRSGHVLKRWWDEDVFLLTGYLTSQQGKLQAGEFHFPAQLTVVDILWILRHGHPVMHTLTIPEGVTAFQFNQILGRAPFMVGQALKSYEGEILPQTYHYERGQSREDFLLQKEAKMQHLLNVIFEGSQKEVAGPGDLLILASLIEKETSVSAEKPYVARVFINRLKKGMKLQTDPSVIYGLTGGENFKRKLTHQDLQTDTPYNTYLHEGLPSMAICFPSKESLLAAAHPVDDPSLLYFVANGHGGHNFTRSYQEHLKNVTKLRAAHGSTVMQ